MGWKLKERKALYILLLMGCLQSACNTIAPSPTPIIQPSITPALTQTASPTPTPTPTITPTQTLTPTRTITPSPTLTPTPIGGGSGMIAFHKWGGDSVDIFTYNLFDETMSRVTRLDSHEWTLSASPDGSWIAFWVLDRNSLADSIYYDIGSLYIVRPDGRDLTKITDRLYTTTDNGFEYVHWSPNSESVIIIEGEGFNSRFLTVYDIESGNNERITPVGYYPYKIMLVTNDGWIYLDEEIYPVTIGALRVRIDGSEIKKLRFTEDCKEFYCGDNWTYEPINDIIVYTYKPHDVSEVQLLASQPNVNATPSPIELNFSNNICEGRDSIQNYLLQRNRKMQWSPDGNNLLVPISDCEVYLWNREDKTLKELPEDIFKGKYGTAYWEYNWSPDSLSIFFFKKSYNNSTEQVIKEMVIYKIPTGEIERVDGLAEEDIYEPVWIP